MTTKQEAYVIEMLDENDVSLGYFQATNEQFYIVPFTDAKIFDLETASKVCEKLNDISNKRETTYSSCRLRSVTLNNL